MSLTIPNLPLYWRFEEKLKSHPHIPQVYDFTFDFDASLNLTTEARSKELISILNSVYDAEANIGYLQEGTNLGSSYGEEYIKFLTKHMSQSQNKILSDIGCGGCLLLERFRELGFSVIGVDPSPIAARAANTKSIDLVQSMLDENTFANSSVDYFTQMDVLEHAFNPVELLAFEREALKDNGLIFINVPNCEQSISLGDISMAIHQHVNMYTRYSLAKVVEAAGLYVHTMKTSDYGSAIYCIASKIPSQDTLSSENFVSFRTDPIKFERDATNRIKRFQNLYGALQNQNNGFYIFQRLLPYLCAADFTLKGRFFDNNTLWHNKRLDGIPAVVENHQDFLNDPTDNLFIFSHSFSSQIIDSLKSYSLSTKMFSQESFF